MSARCATRRRLQGPRAAAKRRGPAGTPGAAAEPRHAVQQRKCLIEAGVTELRLAGFGLRKPDTAKAKPAQAASPLALQMEWDAEALSETGDRSFGLACGLVPCRPAGPAAACRAARQCAKQASTRPACTQRACPEGRNVSQ